MHFPSFFSQWHNHFLSRDDIKFIIDRVVSVIHGINLAKKLDMFSMFKTEIETPYNDGYIKINHLIAESKFVVLIFVFILFWLSLCHKKNLVIREFLCVKGGNSNDVMKIVQLAASAFCNYTKPAQIWSWYFHLSLKLRVTK